MIIAGQEVRSGRHRRPENFAIVAARMRLTSVFAFGSHAGTTKVANDRCCRKRQK